MKTIISVVFVRALSVFVCAHAFKSVSRTNTDTAQTNTDETETMI
jgi:hypothetical protein